jgi:hypothetical protein
MGGTDWRHFTGNVSVHVQPALLIAQFLVDRTQSVVLPATKMGMWYPTGPDIGMPMPE